jgi:Holliday junction DNA helicase RuvA
MIGSLRGQILERSLDGTVLIEVGGIGYVVHVSERVLSELEPGTTAFLHVHHHIREDAQTLYGFLTGEDRTAFRSLLSAHGVGPAMAMAVLATHPPSVLFGIVADNDVAALTIVPGIGKKTAERLIIEIRDKLAVPILDNSNGVGGTGSAVADVREALAGLGYGTDEIRDVLREEWEEYL